jgi:small subunit ribosomal protein S17
VADENNTAKTDETAEETPVEEKPKRTRKKVEPATEAAEAKPKRTRKKAEEAPEEPVAAEPVAEEAEVAPEPEPAPEPVAEEAPAEEPVPEEPVAEEAVADERAEDAQPVEEPVAADQAEDESVAEVAADAEPATDEAAAEQPSETETAPTTRGPKPKKKRLPRSQRHKHAKPKREPAAQRKPITRLPKPEGERGRDQQRRGVVVSAAMDRTIVVRVDSVKSHPKYKKVIRRSKKFHAHDEQNQAKAGDVVRIVETRPLSKTKRWRLAEIIEVAK